MTNNKNTKEYYCCEWINSGLHFQPSRLGFCCYGSQNIGDHPSVIDDYFGECVDEYIFENIKDIRLSFKKGDIPNSCKNCSKLKKALWDGHDKDYIDKFMIGHNHNCNAKCTYCFTNDIDDTTKKRTYDIYPVLDDLFDSGKVKITDSSCVVFLGGEPTIFPEFEDVMSLFLRHNFPNIKIHSSGIKYSKSVAKGLENGNVSIVISPDAATEETYNKIKRVPCFKTVWANIKKYIKKAKESRLVCVKYIIIPGINDNKKEIDKWFDLIVKNGIKYVACDVEQNWFFASKGNFPKEIFELAHYFERKAKELSLNFEFYTEAQRMLKQEPRVEKQRYCSCDLIEHGLDFAPNAINFCCRTTTEGGGFKELIKNYHGELLDLEKFFELKRYYRQKMKSGEGIPECKNCIYLEEKEYDNDDYISSINFNHGLNCNLRCVYCTFTHGEKIDEPEYDVYPVIKQLADEGYLKKGGYITIAGGEPTIYKSFEKLMRLFIDLQMQPIRVLTNGIKYSESIAEGLKLGLVNIMISIDAGSRNMYKWIKGFDLFDKVWDNISKYAEIQKNPYLVKTKYIIIPGINDNKEEVISFLDQNLKYGINGTAFDIELTWFSENYNNIPESLYDFVEFTIEETKKRNLDYEPVDRVVTILQDINKKKNLHISFRGHEL